MARRQGALERPPAVAITVVTRDTELRMRRLSSESSRKRPKGLRTDQRIAQNPLESKKGVVETSAWRTAKIVRFAGVTRARLSLHENEGAVECGGGTARASSR